MSQLENYIIEYIEERMQHKSSLHISMICKEIAVAGILDKRTSVRKVVVHSIANSEVFELDGEYVRVSPLVMSEYGVVHKKELKMLRRMKIPTPDKILEYARKIAAERNYEEYLKKGEKGEV